MNVRLGTETLVIIFASGRAIAVDGFTEEIIDPVCNCDICNKHPEIKSCICELEGRVMQECDGVIYAASRG